MPNWLVKFQDGFKGIHPAFVKGLISILISAFTFLGIFFNSDDVINLDLISRKSQCILLGIIGLVTVVLNQSRDSLSAYWQDKRADKKIEVVKTAAALSSGNTEILTKPN